jgi:hypothetical protein
MRHESLPPSCDELLQERDDAVRWLGQVATRLCEANSDYLAAIEKIIDINRQIGEKT